MVLASNRKQRPFALQHSQSTPEAALSHPCVSRVIGAGRRFLLVEVRAHFLYQTDPVCMLCQQAHLLRLYARRWLEYAGSCSLMGMLLAAAIGIREELTLACLFSLLAVTQSFGLLVELYSWPVVTKDETSYAWPVGRRGFIDAPDYDKNPNALYLISQNIWEGDRVIRDKSGALIAKDLSYLHAQRTSNWTRRLLPYAIGCFPFAVYIVVCTYYLEYNKQRLYESTNGELVIPSWINAALYGTFFLFSSFSYVLPLFQALPPGF